MRAAKYELCPPRNRCLRADKMIDKDIHVIKYLQNTLDVNKGIMYNNKITV